MKILIVTPRIPYPPFRGDKLKIYNIAKHLSKNNSVKILTFHRNEFQLKDLANFAKHGIEIETVKLSLFESLFRTAAALFSRIPFQVAFFKSTKMKKKMGEVLENEKFDAVYYHLIRSAQYLTETGSGKTALNVIDYTDAVSLYLTRFAEIEKNPFKKFFINMEQKRVADYEKIAEKFDTLFICSNVDKQFLLDKGIKAKIELLNNGIDTSYFKADETEFEENRIIFTGNMPYYANYDAALYFADEIFPKILQNVPDAEFFIVGQKPPQKIKALASGKIFVTGFVPDIKKEYLKSAVNVAPMRFGAGTLNKVIESIALGVPVVATKIAVGGLPKELEKYIFVADSADEFASYVVKIIKDPSVRTELMEEGKRVITELLSWDKVVAGFESYLSSEVEKLKN